MYWRVKLHHTIHCFTFFVLVRSDRFSFLWNTFVSFEVCALYLPAAQPARTFAYNLELFYDQNQNQGEGEANMVDLDSPAVSCRTETIYGVFFTNKSFQQCCMPYLGLHSTS